MYVYFTSTTYPLGCDVNKKRVIHKKVKKFGVNRWRAILQTEAEEKGMLFKRKECIVCAFQ